MYKYLQQLSWVVGGFLNLIEDTRGALLQSRSKSWQQLAFKGDGNSDNNCKQELNALNIGAKQLRVNRRRITHQPNNAI